MKRRISFMRLASILLILTLLTTCGIGGTFAKYVTSANGSDSARVAKWGVVLNVADDSSFATSYATTDTKYSGEVSVQSFAAVADTTSTDYVVAPGTASDADGITFSIKGTPEVATKISVEMEVISDIVLKAGTYVDYTGLIEDGTFTLKEDYYPVKFTLTQTEGVYKNTGDDSAEYPYKEATVEKPFEVVKDVNLTAIKAAVEAATTYTDPNHELDSTYVLTWKWDFEVTTGEDEAKTVDKTIDAADTLLGNLATVPTDATEHIYLTKAGDNGTDLTAEGAYSTNLEYKITFTVTQVD